MLNLQDFKCVHDQGILHKYARLTDGAIFSVKTLVASNQFKPEHHPVIQTLEKLAQHSHPNLPKYFGYGTIKTPEYTEILVFLEDSEGALSDYMKQKTLTKQEISSLTLELIDVMIFVDRIAYALPSYITPHSILVSKDVAGNIKFKPFGIMPHDDSRKVTDEDLKWVAPEIYERIRLKRAHLNINAEKAMFYSIGILTLYCASQDLITQGRDRLEGPQFTSQNHERETEAASMARAKVLSMYNDNQLNEILSKLLVYSDKERADFRIWQHILKDAQGGKKGKQARQNDNRGKYVNNNNGNANAGKKDKKNGCKTACCNMF